MPQTYDRPIPQDLDSERALLGSLFVAHRFADLADCDIDDIRAIVTPAAFALREHAELYGAILDAVDAGDPIDPRSVLPRLGEKPGADWPELINDVCIVAEPANGPFYGRQIRACWQKHTTVAEE